ncbi:MAG: glutamine synthetase beta-grasp domain-containing protein [Candidatus Bruticola sp.]
MSDFVSSRYASSEINSVESLSSLLNKECRDFTRSDLLKIIKYFSIDMLTFHYVGLDGRMRSLKLPFSSLKQAERLLALGERTDGSSLFKRLVDASVSDTYAVPVYSSAFINPFRHKSLDFMCRFLDGHGQPAKFTPDSILQIGSSQLQKELGYELWAMGELEFYLIYPKTSDDERYPASSQNGYHISAPYLKYENAADEMIQIVQQVTGSLKYGHSEVGSIETIHSQRAVLNGCAAEQFELEFYPRPITEAADVLCLARWLIRCIAARHGLLATFTPKLSPEAAGTGMHIHMELKRHNVNCMLNSQGLLSSDARKMIGGLVRYAPTISAFGNTQASSFLRLVPNHEAPTKICWSHSNRSSLIRVPLGWADTGDLSQVVNSQQRESFVDSECRQTIELRSPDGSANVYLLLSAMLQAVSWGLKHESESLELAEECHVDGNIFQKAELAAKLQNLPKSCCECADLLIEHRDYYEQDGLFPPFLIDYVAACLRREHDGDLHERLQSLPEEERLQAELEVLHTDLHRC